MAHISRLVLAALVVVAQILAVTPAGAQAPPPPRLQVTFNPSRVTTQVLGGCAPNTNCPLERGTTYTAQVEFTANEAVGPMFIDVEGGNGLEIVATGVGGEATAPLVAGGRQAITLEITIPESIGRRDRTFYLGRVKLQTGDDEVFILPVAVSVPAPRVSWGPLTDPATGQRATAEPRLGSGGRLSRTVRVTSNVDVPDFELTSNAPDRVEVCVQPTPTRTCQDAGAQPVPTELTAGQPQTLMINYTAPITNRRTRTNIVIAPTSGLAALQRTLRIRLTVLPVQITWNPPFVRTRMDLRPQEAQRIQATFTSNYDIDGVSFKTADLGLTPILSPLAPVDMRAGVPQPIEFLVCPGYAPTQYFLGMTAYQGNKPLNRRLQIRSTVFDSAPDEPLPIDAPPCTAP